jgi:glycine/D-amino acid oxidase-like deaminating enzyme
MSLGPVTGKLVARLVGGAKPLADIRPLDPQRFG